MEDHSPMRRWRTLRHFCALPLLLCLFGYHLAGDGYSALEQLQRTSCPSLPVLLSCLSLLQLATVVGFECTKWATLALGTENFKTTPISIGHKFASFASAQRATARSVSMSCMAAKDQYASFRVCTRSSCYNHATRLPVYVRQSIIWQGTWWFTV